MSPLLLVNCAGTFYRMPSNGWNGEYYSQCYSSEFNNGYSDRDTYFTTVNSVDGNHLQPLWTLGSPSFRCIYQYIGSSSNGSNKLEIQL